MLPRVSIVTPSYNQAHFLEETIHSVLDQDYPEIEYIIVDGGSTDGSVEIIQRYADRLAWWVSERDQGQTDALNKGFARATGDIFAWLNSDDTYLPGAVSEAVVYLQMHHEVGLVYGDANYIDEAGRVLGKFLSRQTDYRRLLRGFVYIPQQTTFFRSNLWRQVGPLDPTLNYAMDYDLWVQLAKITKLKYIPCLWANFRLHGTSKAVAHDGSVWPDMVRVHKRESGSRFSWLGLKAALRPYVYAWLPFQLRLWLRRLFPW